MLKTTIITLVLASTIIGTLLLTVYYGRNDVYKSSSFSNLSRDLTFATHNPATVVIGLHLFTVSNYPTYITIESSDWDYHGCNISLVDLSKDKITGRLQSRAVGEKIVVWGSNEVDDQHVDLTFVLLDPWDCSYIALPNLAFSTQNLPMKVVTNQNYLDVFFANQSEKCLPCRFDENGEQIELQHQIQLENGILENSTHIQTFNNGSNYVYSFDFKNGDAAVIQILDQDFNVLEQMNTSYKIHELAVSSGSTQSMIGLLHQSHEQQYHISVFDFSLHPIFTAELPHPHAYKAVRAQLSMDSQGNSFITSVLLGKKEKYHFMRYNATGYLTVELQLDEYQREDSLVTQTFLIDDQEYCLVNHFKAYERNETGRSHIKCVDLSEL